MSGREKIKLAWWAIRHPFALLAALALLAIIEGNVGTPDGAGRLLQRVLCAVVVFGGLVVLALTAWTATWLYAYLRAA